MTPQYMQHVNESWFEKYRPKTIKDLICNVMGVKTMHTWLLNFDKNRQMVMESQKPVTSSKSKKQTEPKHQVKKIPSCASTSCLIVTGPHGVGKTAAVQTIVKQLGYTIETLDFSTYKNNKSMVDNIRKTMLSSNVINVVQGMEKRKHVIIVDELETFSTAIERASALTLQKMNSIYWYCPVIFISHNQHNKVMNEIRKISQEVKFYAPYTSDLRHMANKIITSEKMTINSPALSKIIDQSQQDIRRLISILQDLKCQYGEDEITIKNVCDYFDISSVKDTDVDLFRATQGLMHKYTNIDKCLRYYETEKVLLPLMMHHNYVNSVLDNVDDETRRCEIMCTISDSLCTGDIIENYIYGDQNWNMQSVHGFYTCVLPSYYLSKKLDTNMESEITFTSDLNKTSIKKINRKNISKHGDKWLKNMNIMDYIYVTKIIRRLLDENNIVECVKILREYNIKPEHIDPLLKIDRIGNNKTTLQTKQKKDFGKLL